MDRSYFCNNSKFLPIFEQLREPIGEERDTKPGLIDLYELPAKEVLLERTLSRLEKTEIKVNNELNDYKERIPKLETALETLKSVIEEKKEMEAKKAADRAAKKEKKAEKKKKGKK
jgi:septal ring factor EnvC (AmiA/AmiB activator)